MQRVSTSEGMLVLDDWVAFAARHPHEFTVQYPPRPEYFRCHFLDPEPDSQFVLPATVLVYLHVPFCRSRCTYCDFAVSTARDREVHHDYVDALLRELVERPELQSTTIQGIDIGGGTPTRLDTDSLVRVLRAISHLVDRYQAPCPLSIETTPEAAAEEPYKMAALAEHGVRRISMGIQSFHSPTLKSLNRNTAVFQYSAAMANLRAAGFQRVNVDVIFSLPGQTLSEWREDLRLLCELQPDSITTYDCLYRGIGRRLHLQPGEMPSQSHFGLLYDAGHEILTASGYYAPYGSLNYSRHPLESGTSTYFQNRLLDGVPYLGLGNYATSLVGRRWRFNVRGVRQYVSRVQAGVSPVGDCYLLPQEEVEAKYVLGSLSFGVIEDEKFRRVSGRSVVEAYGEELKYAEGAGWLIRNGSTWRITSGMFRAVPQLRSIFYTQQARTWMRERENELLP